MAQGQTAAQHLHTSGSNPGFPLIVFGHWPVCEAVTVDCGQGDRISWLVRPESYVLSLEPCVQANPRPTAQLLRNDVPPKETRGTVPCRRGK